MTFKNKIILLVLTFVVFLLLACTLRVVLRPAEIVAIHHRSSGFSDILVKNFPYTDQGKIAWWLENEKDIEKKYHLPRPDKDGSFYLTFWLFGDGYKEEGKYDRLCFKDKVPPENCIDKNRVFSVQTGRNGNIIFIARGGVYRMTENGEIAKEKT